MTRRRIYWVPRSSGGLVNLGLDVDDDVVSGLSYVSRSPLHQNTRKLSSQGISSGHKLDQIFLCPIYSILIFFLKWSSGFHIIMNHNPWSWCTFMAHTAVSHYPPLPTPSLSLSPIYAFTYNNMISTSKSTTNSAARTLTPLHSPSLPGSFRNHYSEPLPIDPFLCFQESIICSIWSPRNNISFSFQWFLTLSKG